MPERQNPLQTTDPSFKPILRSIALEIIIYIPLATAFFILLLAFTKDQLLKFYYEMPVVYAIVTLLVILAQGVLLEALTSWVLRKIGLRH